MTQVESKDWKWQVIDEIDAFISRIDPDGERARQILLEDEGQCSLVWDALKPLFPTNRFKPGDKLTALELGRFFGHWRTLWIVCTVSSVLQERFAESHQKVSEVRDEIDRVLIEHAPSALKGEETGLMHLLAAVLDPVSIGRMKAKDREFEALGKAVRDFSCRQPYNEREAFMNGYGQAISARHIAEDGTPKIPNKLAMLLAFCRPFAIRAEMAAGDFQEALDEMAGAQVTGTFERFAKHLQRRQASLRQKGRPLGKISELSKSSRK